VYVQSSTIFASLVLFSALRNVSENTSAVGREALLDSTRVLPLLMLYGGKLTSRLEAKGKQEGGHDGSEEYKA
jgi:hypothetical protein